jgi:hypothetical protein
MKKTSVFFILPILFTLMLTGAGAAAARKLGLNDFLGYLSANKESLQYISVEQPPVNGQMEVKVYCSEITKIKLIAVIDQYDTTKYSLEQASPNNMVFIVLFPIEGKSAEGGPVKSAPAAKVEKIRRVNRTEAISQPDKNRFRVGLIFGRFSLNDKNLRGFYPNWFKNIPGVELSVHTLYNIDVWASYKIYTDEQSTTYYGNAIKFKLVPLSVGLRYRPLKWRFVEPFVGAGLNFYSYSETISGESDLENAKDKATGFHFQGGSYFHVNRFLLGEIFMKYNIVKKTLTDTLPDGTDQLDLGGFEMGIGLVVKF